MWSRETLRDDPQQMKVLSAPGQELGEQPWLVYDGDCPLCSAYIRLLRLQKSIGPVCLINARDGGSAVEEILRAGFDLDEGMVLKIGGRYYHGGDCIHVLALLSSGSNLINRINASVFRSPRLSSLLYPVLRTGRNTLLAILGRRKIAASEYDHVARTASRPDATDLPMR